jgi:hypothetical protein
MQTVPEACMSEMDGVAPGVDASKPSPARMYDRKPKPELTPPVKPTVAELGLDTSVLAWRRSSEGPGAIEVAFAWVAGEEWVLMRLGGDPAGRVSVFSRFEWDCFLDGARNGEFDGAPS